MHELSEIVKEIVLVRNGQAEGQSGGSVQAMNPELSGKGRKQMKAVNVRLKPYIFDFVYVSPLLRAYQSYQIAAPMAYHVELDSRIIEKDEGSNWHQTMVGYLPTEQLSCCVGGGWLIPCERRAEMIAEDMAVSGAEKILIVAHQGIIKYLIAAWLGVDGSKLYKNLLLDNGSFTGLLLDRAGNRLVQYVNDSHHL